MRAGRGLCRESAVRALVGEAPARVADLRDLGVPFDPEPGLEGGHSRRRVLHVAGAATGKEILRVLVDRVLEHPRIRVVRRRGGASAISAAEGALPVSSPSGARSRRGRRWSPQAAPPRSGSGRRIRRGQRATAWPWRFHAGARLADLEFMQFHPTVLAENGLLLSEALRGEGAVLVDAEGLRFTDELAPRDVVARAVGERGTPLLDLRRIDRGASRRSWTRSHGRASTRRWSRFPVSPAAHYTMGGIVTDLHGRTDVAGLYAAGECACTGVHGANHGFELAARVPRLRPPRRPRGAGTDDRNRTCQGDSPRDSH